jgi:hypothetical protein
MVNDPYDIYIDGYRFQSDTLNPFILLSWDAEVDGQGKLQQITETWQLDCIYLAESSDPETVWAKYNALQELLTKEGQEFTVKVEYNGNLVKKIEPKATNPKTISGPYCVRMGSKLDPGTWATQVQFTVIFRVIRKPEDRTEPPGVQRQHTVNVTRTTEEHEWRIVAEGDDALRFVTNPEAAFAQVQTPGYTGAFSGQDSTIKLRLLPRRQLIEEFDNNRWTAVYATERPQSTGGGGGVAASEKLESLSERIRVERSIPPVRVVTRGNNLAPIMFVDDWEKTVIRYSVDFVTVDYDSCKQMFDKLLRALTTPFFIEGYGGLASPPETNHPMGDQFGTGNMPITYKASIAVEYHFTTYNENKIKNTWKILWAGAWLPDFLPV